LSDKKTAPTVPLNPQPTWGLDVMSLPLINRAIMPDDQEQDLKTTLAELRALPRPAMDFSTPEGAILCLEDAYRRRDIEAAVACKDFQVEAVLLLAKTMGDLVDDPGIQAKTAEVLELGFRKEKTGNWPDMAGMESFFVDRRPGFQDLSIVIVTEINLLSDGSLCRTDLQVCNRGNGWKVLMPVEADSADGRIKHHHGWEGDKSLSPTSGQNREAIAKHVEKNWGTNQFILLDGDVDYVELGIHIVPATPEKQYHTLITSGMSDRAMDAPEGAEELRFAEVVISLPADWPLDAESLQTEEHGWPLQWLIELARFPHRYGTWIFQGHTIPNGEAAEPFAENTELCCMLLAAPVLCEEGGEELDLGNGNKIHFLSVIPIYREEMELKMRTGKFKDSSEDLFDKLGDQDVSELLNPNRPNVCA